MYTKKISASFLSFTFLFKSIPLVAYQPVIGETHSHLALEETQDLLICPLSSLIYHIVEWEDQIVEFKRDEGLEDRPPLSDKIIFSDNDVASLWDKVAHAVYIRKACLPDDVDRFQEAYTNYYQAKALISTEQLEEGKRYLQQALNLLSSIRLETITRLTNTLQLPDPLIMSKDDGSSLLEGNRAIPDKAKKKMRPHIIPDNHPMKKKLDLIFSKKRVTLNEQTFHDAGFITKCERPRTFIRVASHPLLPNYLLKVHLDSETRQKYGKPSWRWLVQRCEGADKIRFIIEHRKFKHFTVAHKWIYPLPENPSPPASSLYTRHLAALLVTDMQLTSDTLNYYAWKHYVTKDHLDELYVIISSAKGSSYRPDNISYTEKGTFAFIDTEYPSKGPDYKSIRGFLSPEMLAYWDKLVRKGGR